MSQGSDIISPQAQMQDTNGRYGQYGMRDIFNMQHTNALDQITIPHMTQPPHSDQSQSLIIFLIYVMDTIYVFQEP